MNFSTTGALPAVNALSAQTTLAVPALIAPAQAQTVEPEQAILQDMRDIHEPEPVPAWPPAPGWWLLTLVLVAGLAFLAIKALKYNRKRAYRQEALRELMVARETYRSSGDGNGFAQEILELLKRTALTAYPQDSQRIAGLHGEAWLKFLDETCPKCDFWSSEGRALLQTAYSKTADWSVLQHSYTQARLWILAHRTEGGLLRA
jgi:hypothetical protein